MTDSALWTVGVLGKVHGLKGELYLNLAPGGLERLELGERFFVADEGAGEPRPCALTRAGGTDRRPLVVLDLAATRDQAIALQGLELLAAGDALDRQPHYRVGDLLGLPVRTASGRPVGEVRDVLEAPAHEILAVRAPDGGDVLIPLVDELICLQEGGLTVVDGLLDEPEG
ncbi:MAG: ribosome maturation factor RimM [Deltaproteobacteria bacterium]